MSENTNGTGLGAKQDARARRDAGAGPGAQDAGSGANAALFARAQRVTPGGVNSPVRAFGAVGGVPPFTASAQGAYLVDAEGNRRVDLVCGWGPMLLGHAHPDVVAAVQQQAAAVMCPGGPTAGEVELAQEIVRRVPVIDEVRLVSTGTEATMTALRLARGATGRDLILKFAGCYHGHSDGLLAAAGSGLATLAMPGSAGVPAAVTAQTIVVPYNDLDAVRAAFAAHPGQIAAVITEAAPANMGVITPAPGFNAALAALCHAEGALLICDEVLTGFRVGPAGLWGIDGGPSTAPDSARGAAPAATVGSTLAPGSADVSARDSDAKHAADADRAAHDAVKAEGRVRDAAGAQGAPTVTGTLEDAGAGWAPDLFTFGKVIGGGLPVAALGGRREVMELLAPNGPVYQAGTLSGNPVAVAAGLATLRRADPDVYARIDAASARLRTAVHEALQDAGVPHAINCAGNLFSVAFGDGATLGWSARDEFGNPAPMNEAEVKQQEAWRYAPFFHAMLDAGVNLPPSVYEAWFLSSAHDDAALDIVIRALPAAAQAAAAAHEPAAR